MSPAPRDRRRSLFLMIAVLLAFSLACGGFAAEPEPEPSPTPIVSGPTPTPTETPTLGPTLTPSETPLPTATATRVIVATFTATPSPTMALMSGGLGTGGNSNPAPERPAPGPLQEAQVVKVVDGDTIDVLINGVEYRVRYISVNTPETKHPERGEEPFGAEADVLNRQLVEGKTVFLEKDVSETDQYGRLLRYVYVGDMMVNEELLRQGLAQVVTFPPDVKYVTHFLRIQQVARRGDVGMWGKVDYTPAPIPAQYLPQDPPPQQAQQPPPQQAQQPAVSGAVTIERVNVYDEFVDVRNGTGETVVLNGWQLVSERGNQVCPLSGSIEPGATLRIWARAGDGGGTGFNCRFDSNIWSNMDPDPALLFDATGTLVARFN